MTVYKEYRVGGSGGPFGFLGPLLILAVFFTILFFVAKGVFWVLSWVAPVLLIATLIIDHRVVTDFLKFVWKLLQENPLMGIAALLLIFFGYPVVSGFLFVKAIGKRSIKNALNKMEQGRNTYTEYEEVTEEDDSFLELPPINKKKEPVRQAPSNDYDEMFK